jgi:hypothetical protein
MCLNSTFMITLLIVYVILNNTRPYIFFVTIFPSSMLPMESNLPPFLSAMSLKIFAWSCRHNHRLGLTGQTPRVLGNGCRRKLPQWWWRTQSIDILVPTRESIFFYLKVLNPIKYIPKGIKSTVDLVQGDSRLHWFTLSRGYHCHRLLQARIPNPSQRASFAKFAQLFHSISC